MHLQGSSLGARASARHDIVALLGHAEEPSLDTGGTSRQTPEKAWVSLVATGEQASHRLATARALRHLEPDSPFAAHRVRLRERADAIARCGLGVVAYAHADGRARVVPLSCDDALCPRCAWHRSRKARLRYQVATEKARACGHKLRVMTLTQRVRPGQSWAAAQARLLASFRRFYRNPETRRRVLGGMRRVETTWSRRSQGWHVHIHFVYEGRFWPADELAALWSTYSDGTIVDVREVDRPAEFFKYLLKVAGVPAGKVVEYAVQSSGRRLIEFLGSWRKLEVPEAEDDLDEWFQVDIPRLREALDVCDEDVPYRLHFELPHLGTKDPPALRSWVRRVLASYEKTLGQLCEREVARIFREVARPCRG